MNEVTFQNSTVVVTPDEPHRLNEDAPEANLSVEERSPMSAMASLLLAVSFVLEKPLAHQVSNFPDGSARAWSVVIEMS